MDINDIFRESVSSKTLMPSKSKRKLGATPGLRTLKEGGYGIIDASNGADGVDSEHSKHAKRSESDSADDDDDDDDDEGG
ncbi:hypothetical protein H4S07_005509, partial [Coemansia furcata]